MLANVAASQLVLILIQLTYLIFQRAAIKH
jgi:hypothetical protein